MLIKKWDLMNIDKISSEFKQLNETSLQCYDSHVLEIEMTDDSDHEQNIVHQVLSADMFEINMILSMSWLKEYNSDIDWFKKILCWRFDAITSNKNVQEATVEEKEM
jgi:hypothetical protein